MKDCRSKSSQKEFVFEEKRSKLTLINKGLVESETIVVDGCAITDGIRCDYLHIAKGTEYFIELKGQDVLHAIDQIGRTIKILGVKNKDKVKVSYIICTKSPLTATDIQLLAKKMRASHNAKLIIKSSPFKVSY